MEKQISKLKRCCAAFLSSVLVFCMIPVSALASTGEYTISVDNTVLNGIISSDKEVASKDETITLTATPNTGYALYHWNVTYGNGNTVAVTENKFTMPASNVAVSALFLAENRVKLSKLLKDIDDLNSWEWMPDSYNDLKSVRDSFDESGIEDTTGCPDYVISYMLGELQSKYDALAEVNDKDKLVALAAIVDTLSEADYTALSWEELQTARSEFDIADIPNMPDVVVTYLLDNLQEKYDALEEATDRDKLLALANKVDALNEADYTASSWEELQTARSEFYIADIPNMPDVVVTYLLGNLQEKYDVLEPVTDKDKLLALANKVDTLNEADYTASSWAELQTARSEFDTVDIPNMQDFVVTYLLNNLQEKYNALIPATTKYSVTINIAPNGSIVADKTSAENGSVVTLTVTPDSEYKLGMLTVKDVDGNPIEVKDNKFTMPASAVTVDAVFVKQGIELEDGIYKVTMPYTYDIYNFVSDNVKIVAKDGVYTLTFYSNVSASWKNGSVDNFLISGESDFSPIGFNMFTLEAYAAGEASGFASKNLVNNFDIQNSDFLDYYKTRCTSDNDSKTYTTTYAELSDNIWAFSITVDSIPEKFFISGLQGVYNHETDSMQYNGFQLEKTISVDDIQKIPNSLSEINGTISFNYEDVSNSAFKTTSAYAEYKNGALYVTYDVFIDGLVNSIKNALSAELYDVNGNIITITDNKITVVYDSIDSFIRGKEVLRGVLVNENNGLRYVYSETIICPELTYKPVILVDAETGIKLHTSTKYVSENGTLNIDLVTEKGAWDKLNTDLSYNKLIFFTFDVTDGGSVVTNLGTKPLIEYSLKDGMSPTAMRAYVNLYDSNYDMYAYGWFNSDGVTVGDSYYLELNQDYLDGNWAIYDEKLSDTDGSALVDGTYKVPITTFNASAPDQTSMSASCIGSKATLVVKDGMKYIKLNFAPVDIRTQQGYMIQMWVKNADDEFEEIVYTAYYKNGETFFTDDLNAGTLNFYPENGYFMLPSDDAQFMTRFRVSAMDAIIDGVATRDAIFTIYYDDAEKISDETLDAPIKEALAEEFAIVALLEKEDYTYASWSALTTAYNNAKTLNDNSASATAELTAAHTALRTAIDNLVSSTVDTFKLEALITEAEDYKAENYTTNTFVALTSAITNAKAVLNNNASTQVEIDAVKDSLQAAIDGLKTKDSEKLDINSLPDGKYILTAEMFKTDRVTSSMANSAINHNVWLEVINGEYYLTIQFKGLAIYNEFGYMKDLFYFNAGYTYNQYGVPQGTLTAAKVLGVQKDSEGNIVVDQYNTVDTPYPEMLRIKLVDKASADYVPLQVFVPIMESIADETGTQPVLMKLDWTKIAIDDGSIQPEEPVEQSPAVDITDAATGVKVHADKGVFEEGVKLVVTEITKGADYDLAASALADVGKKFKLYEIHFEDADGKEVQPNGTVTVSYPIPAGYDAANVVLYRINEDGSKTLIKGTVDGSYYTVITKSFSNYALVEKDSTITDEQNTQNVNNGNSGNHGSPQTGDNSNIMLWLLLALASAGMLCVLTFTRKRIVNKGK